jgi:hypothetical protein
MLARCGGILRRQRILASAVAIVPARDALVRNVGITFAFHWRCIAPSSAVWTGIGEAVSNPVN